MSTTGVWESTTGVWVSTTGVWEHAAVGIHPAV
jgi:uncharacterized cupin superfamily protein